MKFTNILISIITAAILLVSIEIWLRQFVQPGNMLTHFWFEEKIYETGDTYANESGIQRFSKERIEGVNTDGFRSPEFSSGGILFLGDSHTYGATAEPYENSFVDLIRKSLKIPCHNTGMPGADLPQYLAVARKYLPVLKPELCVLVMEGGDMIFIPRNPKPFKPLDYWTNVGFIHAYKGQWTTGACEDEPFISLEECYDFYKKYYFDPRLKFSAIATYLFRSIWQDTTFRKDFPERHMARAYVNRIKEVTDENGVKLLIALIPPIWNPSRSLEETQREFDLEGFDVIKPMDISRQADYSRDSVHFNNYGHKKFAKFLLTRIIDSIKKSNPYNDSLKFKI